VGKEACQRAKAPVQYTGEAAAEGRIDRRERPALAHVPHQPAKVRALQAGPRHAMKDGERGIVRHGAARGEHPSHDVQSFLAEAAVAHGSQAAYRSPSSATRAWRRNTMLAPQTWGVAPGNGKAWPACRNP